MLARRARFFLGTGVGFRAVPGPAAELRLVRLILKGVDGPDPDPVPGFETLVAVAHCPPVAVLDSAVFLAKGLALRFTVLTSFSL